MLYNIGLLVWGFDCPAENLSYFTMPWENVKIKTASKQFHTSDSNRDNPDTLWMFANSV